MVSEFMAFDKLLHTSFCPFYTLCALIGLWKVFLHFLWLLHLRKECLLCGICKCFIFAAFKELGYFWRTFLRGFSKPKRQ
ncbi:hypothetical protein HMPREF1322_1722 [Porphyromonas gingivalis W50]|nr:hypothetical protein HMPREF1322_1722 [Porphyromonas gingivalis W50]OWR76506.1 hypothetical protein SJDPG5_01440 [Porphyromonas gingivalis SJD5]PDP41319.1 hypothetical protein CLI84_06000 [Porphyromonas gingivalis]